MNLFVIIGCWVVFWFWIIEVVVDVVGIGDMIGSLGDVECWTGGLVGFVCCFCGILCDGFGGIGGVWCFFLGLGVLVFWVKFWLIVGGCLMFRFGVGIGFCFCL